ncbi:MAG TPA: sugar transferase [Gaiellaceae bacterium]|nr:sugar transferase [Gaiellaceae bacterium]
MAHPAQPVPYPAAKRLLDRTVAVVLLLALSPVLAAAVAAVVLDALLVPRDRGPLLYRERRISRGRPFDLLKLRTLRTDVIAELRRAGGYARTYEADERNLTWAGRRVLKRWYLDELPQLVNVLRGDMSLVGPRAWPVVMVEQQLAEGLDYRRWAIAGLTGPAQVQKGAPDPVSAAELDLAYVERCRKGPAWRVVAADLALLVRTVEVLARGEGLKY